MSDSIIALVPMDSTVDSVQSALSPDGEQVEFVQSMEEALRLLSAGQTPVFFCDSTDRPAWRDQIVRLLRSGKATRVVLLSTVADEVLPPRPRSTATIAA
jgi:CheY-like chemotaxis protein